MFAAGLLLAACGFTPVYGPGGAGTVLRDATTVSAPDTREGFRLLTRIEDSLGRAGAETFHLAVSLDISEERSAVTEDETATRRQVLGVATYRLTSGGPDGPLVTEGRVQSFTSYSTTTTPSATLAAEADARDRLAVLLADLIVARLLAAAPAPGAEPAATPEGLSVSGEVTLGVNAK